ncbi:hypothetical protein HX744_13595 [Pseudonocardia sp. ICBG1122]|nr:hypothetical protein [Pseudonocardia pini]
MTVIDPSSGESITTGFYPQADDVVSGWLFDPEGELLAAPNDIQDPMEVVEGSLESGSPQTWVAPRAPWSSDTLTRRRPGDY